MLAWDLLAPSLAERRLEADPLSSARMADSAALVGAVGALVALSVAVEAVLAVPLTALRVALGVAISVPAHLRGTTLTARPHPILVEAVTLIPTAS